MGDKDLFDRVMKEFSGHIRFTLDPDSLEELNTEDFAEPDFPQSSEPNEYRYLSPAWLDALATGLTAGAKEHPDESWRTIPCKEHLARAMRHIVMYLNGDRSDTHLENASMRLMMAFETQTKEETQ